MKIRNAWKYLPFGSGINYLKKDIDNPYMCHQLPIFVIGILGHMAYAVGAVALISHYGETVVRTGEWNPMKQSEAFTQQRQERQLEERQNYEQNWNKLFGIDGIADVNRDGRVDPKEYADAMRRTGFPQPGSNDLEKAIASYEAEQR